MWIFPKPKSLAGSILSTPVLDMELEIFALVEHGFICVLQGILVYTAATNNYIKLSILLCSFGANINIVPHSSQKGKCLKLIHRQQIHLQFTVRSSVGRVTTDWVSFLKRTLYSNLLPTPKLKRN
jgi:hypothetical protein